jgi:hypothetical protein
VGRVGIDFFRKQVMKVETSWTFQKSQEIDIIAKKKLDCLAVVKSRLDLPLPI